ncbi:MAG: hypothetical protein ABW068_09690 [Candidatus Thiodiazotropha sp.]
MTLFADEIRQPRTPGELITFVESVRQGSNVDDNLRLPGHLRHGYFKEFFDEVMPLSQFAAHIYPTDWTVCPILGNQGYDAEVRDAQGKLVDQVEIAIPIDGRAVAGRQLAQHGITDFLVGDSGDDLEAVIPTILNSASKKAIKDYSDATVVFNVSACPAFEGFEEQHQEQLARIRDACPRPAFSQSECLSSCHRVQ